MGDSESDRESGGSNLAKLIGAIAALITAVTGFLAWYLQHRSQKDTAPTPPVVVHETVAPLSCTRQRHPSWRT